MTGTLWQREVSIHFLVSSRCPSIRVSSGTNDRHVPGRPSSQRQALAGRDGLRLPGPQDQEILLAAVESLSPTFESSLDKLLDPGIGEESRGVHSPAAESRHPHIPLTQPY